MSDSRFVQLTLTFPQSSERTLLAALQGSDAWLDGFSIINAAGHGHALEQAPVQQQVRGHADQRLLLALMSSVAATHLLQRLRGQMPAAGLTWWLTPVQDFGRLA